MVQFDTIETALQQLQNGGYVILSDNEDRENEGDLVALADRITPETVYEMLHEANGLMCVPITIQRAHELGFTKMVEHSTDPNQTPFMTTADGTFEATGVTTGVSAFDRAATIKRIANPVAKPTDFNHPGHIQPLYALDGGGGTDGDGGIEDDPLGQDIKAQPLEIKNERINNERLRCQSLITNYL